eukprot:Clim_evm13s109 gene=Clim_evmTU13s109
MQRQRAQAQISPIRLGVERAWNDLFENVEDAMANNTLLRGTAVREILGTILKYIINEERTSGARQSGQSVKRGQQGERVLECMESLLSGDQLQQLVAIGFANRPEGIQDYILAFFASFTKQISDIHFSNQRVFQPLSKVLEYRNAGTDSMIDLVKVLCARIGQQPDLLNFFMNNDFTESVLIRNVLVLLNNDESRDIAQECLRILLEPQSATVDSIMITSTFAAQLTADLVRLVDELPGDVHVYQKADFRAYEFEELMDTVDDYLEVGSSDIRRHIISTVVHGLGSILSDMYSTNTIRSTRTSAKVAFLLRAVKDDSLYGQLVVQCLLDTHLVQSIGKRLDSFEDDQQLASLVLLDALIARGHPIATFAVCGLGKDLLVGTDEFKRRSLQEALQQGFTALKGKIDTQRVILSPDEEVSGQCLESLERARYYHREWQKRSRDGDGACLKTVAMSECLLTKLVDLLSQTDQNRYRINLLTMSILSQVCYSSHLSVQRFLFVGLRGSTKTKKKFSSSFAQQVMLPAITNCLERLESSLTSLGDERAELNLTKYSSKLEAVVQGLMEDEGQSSSTEHLEALCTSYILLNHFAAELAAIMLSQFIVDPSPAA